MSDLGPNCLQRPNKKNTCVYGNPTLPQLSGETWNFFWFSGKKIILCILIGKMPFKMHKIDFFLKKKTKVFLKFPDQLLETHLFFIS